MLSGKRRVGHEVGELQTLMPRTLQLAQPKRDFLCALRFLPGASPPTFSAGITMELLDQNEHRLSYFDVVFSDPYTFNRLAGAQLSWLANKRRGNGWTMTVDVPYDNGLLNVVL